MSFDFASAKALARQVVHSTLGVRAFYQDTSMSSPVEMKARWNCKIDRMGDLDNQSYAELIQGIDRVIFEAAEARTYMVKRGGTVTFPDYGSGLGVGLGSPLGGEDIGPPAFVLQNREPADGPFSEVWSVTRKERA